MKLIFGDKTGLITSYKNGNKLDFRVANIEFLTHREYYNRHIYKAKEPSYKIVSNNGRAASIRISDIVTIMVDSEDIGRIIEHNWRYNPKKGDIEATFNGAKTTLHRFIMNPSNRL